MKVRARRFLPGRNPAEREVTRMSTGTGVSGFVGLAALAALLAAGCSPDAAQPMKAATQDGTPTRAPVASTLAERAAPSDEGTLALDVTDRPLVEVVALIQEKADANLLVSKDAERVPVTLKLPRPAPWREVLGAVAKQARGVEIQEESPKVIRLDRPPRVNFEFENADVRVVIKALSDIAGANIVVAREVEGTVTVTLREVPWRAALDSIVEPLGYRVVKDAAGILRVGPADVARAERDAPPNTAGGK
jgi:hypothetical protein